MWERCTVHIWKVSLRNRVELGSRLDVTDHPSFPFFRSSWFPAALLSTDRLFPLGQVLFTAVYIVDCDIETCPLDQQPNIKMAQRTLTQVERSKPAEFSRLSTKPSAAAAATEDAAPSSDAQKAAHYGLLVNICMVVIKAVGGFLFSSESLLADAFHSATDILADLVTLATVLLSRGDSRRARTVEGLGSLCVSGFIFTGGFAIALHGLAGMRPFCGGRLDWLAVLVDAHEGGESVLDDVPNVLAAWVALASILAKEWVYRISEFLPDNGGR